MTRTGLTEQQNVTRLDVHEDIIAFEVSVTDTPCVQAVPYDRYQLVK